MLRYLLIVSDSEGICVKANHLPQVGDTIDVMKDYGVRERFRFRVETVLHDIVVEDVPIDGARGLGDTLPQVEGKIIARRVDGQWVPA